MAGLGNETIGRGTNWRHPEVDKLIEIWAESSISAIFNSKGKNTKGYIKVAQRMEEAGYNRSQSQIQIKIKNLRRSYYKAKREIKNGTSRESLLITCPYFDRIHSLMGKRHFPSTSGLLSNSSSTLEEKEGMNELQEEDSFREDETDHQLLQLRQLDLEPINPELYERAKKNNEREARIDSLPDPDVDKVPNTSIPIASGPIARPAAKRRWRAKNDYMDSLEKMFNEERQEMRQWQQNMWNQQLAMEEERHRREEERQRREEEIFKQRMKVDEEVSKGMLNMMGQMLNIMSKMGSNVCSHRGSCTINAMDEQNVNCIATTENQKRVPRGKGGKRKE